MRGLLLALLLTGTATVATAASGTPTAPITKEQLMAPPTGARHFTISSVAEKHGDVWSWTTPDERIVCR